jgi:hypothetical protein
MLIISAFAVLSYDVCSAATAQPAQIKLYLGPNKLPADGEAYVCIFVALLDSSGKPARAPSYLTFSVSSSKTDIGTVDQTIQFSPGQTYGNTTFYTTTTPGSTVISVAATDFITVKGTITTTTLGETPAKLVVYSAPALLPADGKEYRSIEVQIQDAKGHPTNAGPDGLSINMFSSEPTVASLAPLLNIPSGKSQAFGTIKVSNSPGSASITAQLSGLSNGQAKLTTYQIDLSTLKGTLEATEQSVLNGNMTDIIANITADGVPITGVTVKFSSSNGGKFSSVKDQTGGLYKTTFTAPSFSKVTDCVITASFTKTGYMGSQATAKIAVGPTAIGNKTTLQFLLINEAGEPLSNALVSSIIQPNGVSALTDLTNTTGYVTFSNLLAGSYSFKIIKDGYEDFNETLTLKGQPLALTVTMLGSNAIDTQTLVLIAVTVIIATVVALVSGMLIIRRKRSAKIRKLQDLQKQVKYKQ